MRKLVLSLAATLLATSALAGAPATTFTVTNLVSNQPGQAPVTDPDLVNAWGMSQAQGGPLWVSDNGTGKITAYDRKTGAKQDINVTVPDGVPTGQVFVRDDGSGRFTVHHNGTSGIAAFLFATENGRIAGWNPNVNPTHAITVVNREANGAAYKGLALADGKSLLYAANFTQNAVDVFDANFNMVNTFTDPTMPANYAPFNVAVLNGRLYVAFALRAANSIDEIDGTGLGGLDSFKLDGTGMQRIVSPGEGLNAPWGLAIAPSKYGTFSGDLLVGSFGNGSIDAFDPTTNAFIQALTDSSGNPIVIPGLWALDAGAGSLMNFAAGPNAEANGLVGTIRPNN
jgi:uncharacterized protein (TIGR03118 family)